MNVSFRLITADDVKHFIIWRYAPPYDIYNIGEEDTDAEIEYFLNPIYQVYAMVDGLGSLVAYCSFGKDGQVPGGDYSDNALDIGLGLRPDLTNQGKGVDYVQKVNNFAISTFDPKALRVTIAEFNLRAQKVWQKAGFVKVSHFESTKSKIPFVIYSKNVD
jgi:[ribosomal protein S18]-alanine N-acetyltransferase